MTTTPIDVDDSLDIVRKELERFYREEKGEALDRVEVTRVERRSFSGITFLSAHTRRGSDRLVVKQICKHPLNAAIVPEPDQAVVEFKILQRLYAGFADLENCSVPRPLLVIPEIDALVIEHVEGHLLADDLRYVRYFASRARFRELQQRFYDCGCWLRRLWEVTGIRRGDATAVQGIVTRCQDRLRMIEQSGDRRIAHGFCARARELIEAQVRALADEEIPITGRHGDFGPWNILAHSKGIVVLDFYGYREDPLPVDVLKMHTYLEAVAHGVVTSRRRVAALQERFLAGVGTLPQVPSSLLTLCEAADRVGNMAGTAAAVSDTTSRRIERRLALRADLRWIERESRKVAGARGRKALAMRGRP